ncbi:hypothetical protein BSKO_01570 [Bryopsis sp. KO-2023]|nr:hypothetical protein BSKO_01570 [Bryopsis sp. KO-2023]
MRCMGGSVSTGARFGNFLRPGCGGRGRLSTKATGGGSGGSGGKSLGGGGGGGEEGGKAPLGWAGALWAAYLRQLTVRPIMTKALTSGALNAVGDVLCQNYFEPDAKFNYKRLATFSFLGFALVGPTLHTWYGVLTRIFTAPGAKGAIGSLALDQLLFAPAFCGVFFASLLTLEGRPQEVPGKLKQDWFGAVLMNWKIWVPAQLVNFWLIPPHLRVLCANMTALVWNTYLSWASHTVVKELHEKKSVELE